MIEQFQHKFTTSFLLWFDNFLLSKGEAFSNKTGSLYYYEDPHLHSTFKAYGSPYKQWVTDSSIENANIPNGVFINGSLSGRSDGVKLDFENGRALLDHSSESLDVTGSFAVKDFNVYHTNETEDDLIVEKKYTVNSRLPGGPDTAITPYDQVVPAIFLSSNTLSNKGFALGGMEETTIRAGAVILAEDSYQLDGVLSIFADSHNEAFTRIPMSGHPMNEYADLKDGSYSYTELVSNINARHPNDRDFYVENVTTSKLADKARKSLANDLFVGFIDFDIQTHRRRFQ
tara:strand:- start:117 stop:977 length:861 start_codon:yes stop_codon:yes gene_type:complete